MTWINRYQPPTHQAWHGRNDLPPCSCLFQILELIDLSQDFSIDPTHTNFAFLGFCCDEGIRRNFGRIGAEEGPALLRQAIAKLPLHRDNIACFDAGDITCQDGNLEQSQLALAEAVYRLLEKNITPILLGGGHELAFGHYQGIEKFLRHEKLGIINFDAHFDMRPLLPNDQGSSGTPFLQIANSHEKLNKKFDYNCIGIQPAGNIALLFETAKKHHVHMITADEIHQHNSDACNDLIDRMLAENDYIYLTLCLDVFAAPYAPGVSAPQPFGLTPWEVSPLVKLLAQSGKILSYDIAEYSPLFDVDARTAKLAANFIYDIIHHHKNK